MTDDGHRSGRKSHIYCVVPGDLAGRLHETLRRHFADDPSIEVVVERRRQDRRRASDRRADPTAYGGRRSVRNPGGRRVAELRGPHIQVDPPTLPRKAQRHLDRLLFLERVEPSTEHAEDRDTARIVTRFQAGERDAFAVLYTRYFDRVYGYLRLMIRDQHEAEDGTQQIFMKVLEALPRYERRSQPFRAWLFTVVRNHALEQLGKQGRLEVTDPVELGRIQEDEVEEENLEALAWISDRELLMFVERLPLPQQHVLVLRYMLGLSYAEVAQVLGRSEGSVRTLQSRGLRFLRKRLVAVGRTPRPGRDTLMKRFLPGAAVVRSRRFALLGH